jgi:hypothetical protein
VIEHVDEHVASGVAPSVPRAVGVCVASAGGALTGRAALISASVEAASAGFGGGDDSPIRHARTGDAVAGGGAAVGGRAAALGGGDSAAAGCAGDAPGGEPPRSASSIMRPIASATAEGLVPGEESSSGGFAALAGCAAARAGGATVDGWGGTSKLSLSGNTTGAGGGGVTGAATATRGSVGTTAEREG